eukprot:10242711-Alexandrium_andersonii.AAC.1
MVMSGASTPHSAVPTFGQAPIESESRHVATFKSRKPRVTGMLMAWSHLVCHRGEKQRACDSNALASHGKSGNGCASHGKSGN